MRAGDELASPAGLRAIGVRAGIRYVRLPRTARSVTSACGQALDAEIAAWRTARLAACECVWALRAPRLACLEGVVARIDAVARRAGASRRSAGRCRRAAHRSGLRIRRGRRPHDEHLAEPARRHGSGWPGPRPRCRARAGQCADRRGRPRSCASSLAHCSRPISRRRWATAAASSTTLSRRRALGDESRARRHRISTAQRMIDNEW